MATSRVHRPCAICGAPMLVYSHRPKTYCSNACRGVGIRTHGEISINRNSVEYNCWRAILKRCLNPKTQMYPRYGGRGITVCDKWRNNFAVFLADVGRRPSPAHSLDRWPNNMGNYEPGNVRWATDIEQNTNKPNNRLITFNGVTRCVSDWARETGIKVEVLYHRLDAGWSAERALTTVEKEYLRLEDRPNAKLTVNAVHHIRSCDMTVVALARLYGVSKSTVRAARQGKTWASC